MSLAEPLVRSSALSSAAQAFTAPDLRLRPAVRGDSRRIAELFRIASSGVADYVWRQLDVDGDTDPLDIGQRRYEREDAAFSYQNCTVAVAGGEVVGMAHAFLMPMPGDPDRQVDPVLRPYDELEMPGSFYLSGLAVMASHRDRGIGSRLLAAVRARARFAGARHLSLICFEENEGALRLYRRLGFMQIDQRPVVPHPLIRHTGEALLLARPV